MDISTITDINQLKAMAYDELVRKEAAESNLRAINQQIFNLQNQPAVEPPQPKKPRSKKKR